MEERIIERWYEKFGGSKEELKNELLDAIKRGKRLGILAAQEAILKFPEKEVLYEILKMKVKENSKKLEERKVKIEAVKIARERNFIDEKFLLLVLEEVEDKRLKKEIAKEYLEKNKKVSRELLKEIVKNTGLREAVKRLLKIARTPEDLLPIIENAKGKIRFQALRKIFDIGISKEDFLWLVAFEDPQLAEIAWEKGKQNKIFETLNIEEIYEIAKYTDAEKVKKDALNLMWLRKECVTEEEQLEFLEENAGLINIERPEIVKKWTQTKLILETEITLERILEIQENAEDPQVKFEATKIAIKRIIDEIADLRMREINKELTYWENERLKSLEKKLEKLRSDYSKLAMQIT